MLPGYHFRILANISPTSHPAPAQATGQTGRLLVDIGSPTSGHYAPLPQLESERGQIAEYLRLTLGDVTFRRGLQMLQFCTTLE